MSRLAGRAGAAALLAASLLGAFIPPVQGQVKPRSSANQGATSMDEIDMGTSLPAHRLFPVPENPEDRIPFLHDGRFGAQLRSFYFNQDKFNNTRSEAWTLGGSLAYQSGYLADTLRIGAVAYTSQRLNGPKDRDGTLLLKPGQESYTVLGQIYGEVRFSEALYGAIGRKGYNTPYLNGNDSRMSPNTFEGATLYGKTVAAGDGAEWRYGGGYISKIKPRNRDDFVWMSTEAGARVDRGVYVAGLNYANQVVSIGATTYQSPDIINIFYSETKLKLPLGSARELRIDGQFSNQRSAGDDLLTGKEFSNHQWGIKGDLDLGAPMFTVGYTATGNGANMRNPWSAYPGYTDAQVETFNRARENAVLVRAEYDFVGLGARGLSAYALLIRGSGVKAPSFNENEMDLNLQWAPPEGALRGTSIRLRYANVKQRGGGDPNINDFRVILNYDFP
jgi:hypothetical protein